MTWLPRKPGLVHEKVIYTNPAGTRVQYISAYSIAANSSVIQALIFLVGGQLTIWLFRKGYELDGGFRALYPMMPLFTAQIARGQPSNTARNYVQGGRYLFLPTERRRVAKSSGTMSIRCRHFDTECDKQCGDTTRNRELKTWRRLP